MEILLTHYLQGVYVSNASSQSSMQDENLTMHPLYARTLETMIFQIINKTTLVLFKP